MDEKRTDAASEPVDTQDEEFTDTGVLHERPKKAVDPDDKEEDVD